jgi:hypothetical protein
VNFFPIFLTLKHRSDFDVFHTTVTMSSVLTCYTIGLNFVTSSNQYFPCGTSNSSAIGSAQVCCYGNDICLEDGLCRKSLASPRLKIKI